MQLSRVLCLAVLSGFLWAGDDAAETARKSEYESIQKEMEALRPGPGAMQEEVLTFIEAAKEKFGGFAQKHKKTPEGFEASTLVLSMLAQMRHPEALKYAELAVEVAPAAGVDIQRVALCWKICMELRMQALKVDEALAALEKIKPLNENLYNQIKPQFDAIIPKFRKLAELAERLKPGNEAFRIVAKDIDGKDFDLADWKGKVVMIDFWATWCGPCIQLMPELKALYAEYHDKGFEVIGISADENEGQLRNVIEQLGLPWRTIADFKGMNGALPEEWGITGLPSTYLLDKKGIIRHFRLFGPELKVAIEKLLAE